jgi:hypothetical protein
MTNGLEARRKLVDTIEVRNFSAEGLEVRNAPNGADTIAVSGFPIVYNSAYKVYDGLGPPFQETMRPGVVTNLLARGVDCRFLLNHSGLPLARSTAGTLTLTDTPTKLGFTATLDARQSLANDLAIAIERGDISQMSVGMIVGVDDWADNETRTIHSLSDLLDVSAVGFAASPSTSIGLARQDEIMATLTEIRQSRGVARPTRTTEDLRQRRAEMRMDEIRRNVASIERDMNRRGLLTTAQQKDLPDSAFAFIEDGGIKDGSGKTVPRKLRHFPVHDPSHVRNALSRIAQGAQFGKEATPKVLAAAHKFGIQVSKGAAA